MTSTDDFYTYNDQTRTAEDRERDNRGWSWTSQGRKQDWETGEIYD